MREEVPSDPTADAWFDRTAAPTVTSRYLLGDLLVARGLITNAQLESALATQQRQGGRLGEILVADGAVTLTELDWALAEQEGLEAEVPANLSPFGLSRYGTAS